METPSAAGGAARSMVSAAPGVPTMRRSPLWASHAVAAALLAFAVGGAVSAWGHDVFTIRVIDEATGRGVPLIELRTVNDVTHVTDSAGVVAFDEPGLMGHRAFFHVAGHGYEFPADGFGYRGVALDVTPGGSATVTVRRVNIAQRLYRVTGEGIYRDTALAGLQAPLRRPLLAGMVLGSDSVLNTVYRGRIHWFWGDTNRPGYPLGNFHVPGATSLLPSAGGLDPDVGVDLDYFLDEDGFAKETAHMPGEGPTWLAGLVALPSAAGGESLFASYAKIRPPLEAYERGLCRFDDATECFLKIADFPLDAPLRPDGHPFLHEANGVRYAYFATPYPLVRVRATPEDLQHLERYEGFTCLVPGTRLADRRLDRDGDGRIVWGWKRGTEVVLPAAQDDLVKAGLLQPEECLLCLRDVDSGAQVLAHGGSVYWNAYRRRFVMIAVQLWGSSALGEVWYAEADTPVGPWVYARKIVTHDEYSFYNPKQHPMFDKDGGRAIYFEGTYTATFSGAKVRTPRYEYNQVMYKLELTDPRLALPVPVYRDGSHLHTGAPAGGAPPAAPAFFAPDRPAPGTVPVFDVAAPGEPTRLSLTPQGAQPPIFHALPAGPDKDPSGTAALCPFAGRDGRIAWHSVDAHDAPAGHVRIPEPLCLVWESPSQVPLPVE